MFTGVNLSSPESEFHFDGVNIALQVDLSQNASLNHQDGWCIGFRSKPFITYAWIAKAVEDGFLCKRQLCHYLRSKETLVYVPVYTSSLYENSMCRPESQLIEFSVGEYLQFKQRFLFSNFHLWKQKYK